MVELDIDPRILYVLLIIFFLIFIVTKNISFAVIAVLLLVGAFFLETAQGVRKEGAKNEIKEIVISIIVAAVIWYGAGFLLNTPAPLDAVVSCSMLPNLERGDMVVLQGAQINAPEINLSKDEWKKLENWSFYDVCDVCFRLNETNKNVVAEPCLKKFIPDKGVDGEVAPSPEVEYICGLCKVRNSNGSYAYSSCTKSIKIYGKAIEENLGNDIIVYEPLKSDVFKGDTIHRVYAKILVGDEYYYLTKGDNNQQFDQQWGNQPISQDRVKGKVIFKIPYIGYFKLLLFGSFITPPGCDMVIQR
jgi:hypothetical protein